MRTTSPAAKFAMAAAAAMSLPLANAPASTAITVSPVPVVHVRETDDRREAMEGAQVIYAKSWSSTRHYGDKVTDKKYREDFVDWCVDEPWFDLAAEDCRFMHCLPVRRGVVVSDAVLDGPRSIVIHEARNRMLAQMAVLHQMMGAT